MKRIISIAVCLCLAFLFLCSCESAEEPLNPTKEFYVNDFAQVLTDSDKDLILSKAVNLQKKTTAQVVVLTVNSLNGREPYDFAADIGNKWGVGDKEKDNGVIILLSVDDRKIEISTGEGIGGVLPASKAGRIIDVYGIPYLSDDEFSKGVTAIFEAVVNEIYLSAGIDVDENYIPIEQVPPVEETSSIEVIISWVIMLVIIIIISFISRRRGGFFFIPFNFRGPRGGGFGGFGGGSSGGFGGFGGGGSFGGGGAGRGF